MNVYCVKKNKKNTCIGLKVSLSSKKMLQF